MIIPASLSTGNLLPHRHSQAAPQQLLKHMPLRSYHILVGHRKEQMAQAEENQPAEGGPGREKEVMGREEEAGLQHVGAAGRRGCGHAS